MMHTKTSISESQAIRSIASIPHMVSFLLLIASTRAWLTLTIAQPTYRFEQSFLNLHHLFDYAYSFVMVAMVFAALRGVRIASKMSLKIVGYTAITASTMIFLLRLAGSNTFIVQHPDAICALQGLLGGIGYSLIALAWSELLVSLSLAHIALFICSSQVLASAIVFFCNGLDQTRFMAALVLLIVVSCLALQATRRSLIADDLLADKPAPPRLSITDLKRIVPHKLVIVLAMYFFAYGLRQGQYSEIAGIHSSVSTALIMTAIFCGIFYFSDKISLAFLCRTTPLIMLCGFLLVPLQNVRLSLFSVVLIASSMTLMRFVASLIMYDLAKRFDIPVVVCMGALGSTQIFSVWGDEIGVVMSGLSLDPAVQSYVILAAVVVTIFIATLIMFSEHTPAPRWGFDEIGLERISQETAELLALQKRCDELSQAHRLSPREDEILRLYAAGKTARDIQQELIIAEGTVKAHTRHIYEKMGITSKKELMSLVHDQAE